MAHGTAKWWHGEDKEVQEVVASMAGAGALQNLPVASDRTSLHAPVVVTAPTRPPRIRMASSPSLETMPTAASQQLEEIHIVTAKARPPRPRIAPGTPLLSHRNASPTPRSRPTSSASPTSRSRPTSSCRSSPSCVVDGKITVYIHNIHTSDTLALRVHPDIKVGVGLNLHDADVRLESGSSSQVEGGTANDEHTLKTMVAKICGIEVLQIRFSFRGSPLGNDENTLCCYGVADGDTVQLRLRRLSAAAHRESCAKEIQQDEDNRLRPYVQLSPSARSRFDQRCAENGASVMPRWVSQEKPKLFAPVGAGLDGHGNDRPFEYFNEQGIWIPPVDHVNHRGQNQYGLQRVRESLSAKGGA